MERQGSSFETDLQSVVLGLHRLVKIMNYLTSFPEKNLNLAVKQKMDAEAMLNDITCDARQLKVILTHYHQEVSTSSLNTKQNEMEEFIASFETPTVTETDSKTTTTKKKRTARTTPSTSGMKTRLRTLAEMAKDIARQEKESSHIRDLVSMADIVEALTHSVALTSAMDRRLNTPSPAADQSESDDFRHTTQSESNSTGPINHVESGGVIPTNQSDSDSYRNINPDSDSTCISNTIIPIHQVRSGRNLQSSDIQADDRPIHHVQSDSIRPTQSNVISIHHAQSEGIRPTQNIELNDTGPIHHSESGGILPPSDIQSDGVRPTQNIESNGVIPIHHVQSDVVRPTQNTESNGKPIRHVQSCCTCMRPIYDSESNGISSVQVSGQTTVPYSDTSPTTTYSQISKYMNIIQRRLKSQLLRWSGGSIFKLFLLPLLIILTVLAIFMQYCYYSNKDRCLCVQYLLSSFVHISCCPHMVL
ncbi:uncharacterized protein LOC121390645 [Gigantopelta aegis]|uniref:uncharacterized protein LOC121390645 n=1 Tax=Gigantopelta aegis TaxID=1735272 RepID=UPI001B88D89E|nr:uncharacterized protein LOC121390645 [Gigantopelta aegis]